MCASVGACGPFCTASNIVNPHLWFPWGWLQESTVKPFAQFDPEADSKILHTAMKGLFKDEAAVIRVLAYRSNQQRQQLKQKYKVLFGKVCV